MGAHVCGFVGQKLKTLSRITGLDPAGRLLLLLLLFGTIKRKWFK